MDLVADPTLPEFNAYCDVAFADQYHQSRLHNEAYVSAGVTQKEAALIWGTRLIDTLSFSGSKTDPDQPLAWPRYGVVKDEASGAVYGSDEIPLAVKNALAELALSLIESDTTAESVDEKFDRIRVDTIELELRDSGKVSNGSTPWLTPTVAGLLRHLMGYRVSSINARTIRT